MSELCGCWSRRRSCSAQGPQLLSGRGCDGRLWLGSGSKYGGCHPLALCLTPNVILPPAPWEVSQGGQRRLMGVLFRSLTHTPRNEPLRGEQALPRPAPEIAASPPPYGPWPLCALTQAVPPLERSCKATFHGCPPPCHHPWLGRWGQGQLRAAATVGSLWGPLLSLQPPPHPMCMD